MTVDEFLSSRSPSPEVRDLAVQTRELILASVPGVVESVHSGRNILGYGTGGRMAELVCYIAPFKSHVNLGFLRGSELPDPDGLIEGTGKVLRHVKIKSAADLQRPAVRRLIDSAFAEAGA